MLPRSAAFLPCLARNTIQGPIAVILMGHCCTHPRDDLRLALLIQGEGLEMSIESAGWYMDDGPPSWRPEGNAFSFYLRKLGHNRVLCGVSIVDALEGAVQSNDLSETILSGIFDAHRQMIELRAA